MLQFSGLFLDIVKKTQAQKNSKLKQNLEKTQAKSGKNSKTANSSWVQMVEFFYKPYSFPIFALVVNFWNCKFENTIEILHSQWFFTHNTDIFIKFCSDWKVIKEARTWSQILKIQ